MFINNKSAKKRYETDTYFQIRRLIADEVINPSLTKTITITNELQTGLIASKQHTLNVDEKDWPYVKTYFNSYFFVDYDVLDVDIKTVNSLGEQAVEIILIKSK